MRRQIINRIFNWEEKDYYSFHIYAKYQLYLHYQYIELNLASNAAWTFSELIKKLFHSITMC